MTDHHPDELVWRVADALQDGRLPLAVAVEWSERGHYAWEHCPTVLDLCCLIDQIGQWPAHVAGLACARFALPLCGKYETPMRRGVHAADACLRGDLTAVRAYRSVFDEVMRASERADDDRNGRPSSAADATWAVCSGLMGRARQAALMTHIAHAGSMGLSHSSYAWQSATVAWRRDIADAVRAVVPFPTLDVLLAVRA